jgi:hypothetical protein
MRTNGSSRIYHRPIFSYRGASVRDGTKSGRSNVEPILAPRTRGVLVKQERLLGPRLRPSRTVMLRSTARSLFR